MKICIVTGGSGGHIFPALTFADGLRDRHDITFIGNDHKMESWIVPQHNYTFKAIHNQGLQGSKLDRVRAVFSQFKAVKQAKDHLKAIKPDVVVSFGGYVSFPVVYAAKQLGIKIILHEQNASPGKANKMAARYANAIITCYPESFASTKNVHMFGNPRASLVHEMVDHRKEYDRLNLREDLPLVLMVMGSQGSSSMNEKFLSYIEGFNHDDYQVVVVVGPINYEGFMKRVSDVHPNVHIADFVDQRALLKKISLIVCRSGASTIAEIQSFGLPSLLIPSPHVANNHQFYNAKSLVDQGAADMLEEKGLTGVILDQYVDTLMHDQVKRDALSASVLKLAMPNALSDMVSFIEDVSLYAKK